MTEATSASAPESRSVEEIGRGTVKTPRVPMVASTPADEIRQKVYDTTSGKDTEALEWLKKGEPERAMETFDHYIEIRKGLLSHHGNYDYALRLDIAASCEEFGRACLQMNESEKALRAFDVSLEVLNAKMFKNSALNQNRKIGLAHCCKLTGDASLDLDKTAMAVKHFTRSYLTQKDGTFDDTELVRELVKSMRRLLSSAPQSSDQNNGPKPPGYPRSAVDVETGELPASTSKSQKVKDAYEFFGNSMKKDAEEAYTYLENGEIREARSTFDSLADAGRGYLKHKGKKMLHDLRFHFAARCEDFGKACFEKGESKLALQAFETGTEILYAKMYQTKKNETFRQANFAHLSELAGEASLALDLPGEAARFFSNGVEVLEEFLYAEPDEREQGDVKFYNETLTNDDHGERIAHVTSRMLHAVEAMIDVQTSRAPAPSPKAASPSFSPEARPTQPPEATPAAAPEATPASFPDVAPAPTPKAPPAPAQEEAPSSPLEPDLSAAAQSMEQTPREQPMSTEDRHEETDRADSLKRAGDSHFARGDLMEAVKFHKQTIETQGSVVKNFGDQDKDLRQNYIENFEQLGKAYLEREIPFMASQIFDQGFAGLSGLDYADAADLDNIAFYDRCQSLKRVGQAFIDTHHPKTAQKYI